MSNLEVILNEIPLYIASYECRVTTTSTKKAISLWVYRTIFKNMKGMLFMLKLSHRPVLVKHRHDSIKCFQRTVNLLEMVSIYRRI